MNQYTDRLQRDSSFDKFSTGEKETTVSSTEVSEAKYVDLLEAGKSIIGRMSEQYKAGNGRMCGIQDEHGDKMYIVPFDDIERLREVLSTPVDTKRKWKWDIHFSTLFDTIETMDEFFKELMKQMNVVINNSQFEILKVNGNPISFTALPVPDKFKLRTRPGSTRVRPMPRIPDPITYTIRFEKFEEPTPSPSTTDLPDGGQFIPEAKEYYQSTWEDEKRSVSEDVVIESYCAGALSQTTQPSTTVKEEDIRREAIDYENEYLLLKKGLGALLDDLDAQGHDERSFPAYTQAKFAYNNTSSIQYKEEKSSYEDSPANNHPGSGYM